MHEEKTLWGRQFGWCQPSRGEEYVHCADSNNDIMAQLGARGNNTVTLKGQSLKAYFVFSLSDDAALYGSWAFVTMFGRTEPRV